MKLCLLPLLCIGTMVHSQPKIVSTLTNNGPKYGGSIMRVNLPSTAPGVIYSFDHTAPHRPVCGVTAGDGNWLYGLLNYNGTNDLGALYKIQRNGTGFTKLYDFTSVAFGGLYTTPAPYYHTDGNVYFSDGNNIKQFEPLTSTITDIPIVNPIFGRSLHIDDDDWIYYLTIGFNPGLEKIKTDGTNWTQLHTFNFATEGYASLSGVTEVPGDTLFGLMSQGGVNNGGTIFSIKKDGTGFVIHHQFQDATGSIPISKLIYFDGKLFGTTIGGGNNNIGVLFSINADGSNYRVLHHFHPGVYGVGVHFGNIAISSNGRIFGSFSQAYDNTHLLFKMDTSGQNFSTFGNGFQLDIGYFGQDILLLNDDHIYFATAEMGRHDGGALSDCDTSGNGGPLYSFGASLTGFRPKGGVIKASNGKLYGTASIGGTNGNGVVFSVNQDGTNYLRIREFSDPDGFEPSGALLEASDGKLYGACRWGGLSNAGTLFRLNKDGTAFQVIYTFPDFSNGYSPVGGLVEGSSGALYGTTFYGGSAGTGVVFRINKDGTGYTLLKSLDGGTQLGYPYNGVTLAGNYLYGACGYGGAENKGGVFRVRTDGANYQVLHDFTGANSGSLPVATPIVASNGKLYGTANNGGANSEGIVYRVDTTGTNFTVLRDLSSTTDGAYPWGGMIQASDGLIYGTTSLHSFGTAIVGGTLFRMNLDGSNFTVLREFDHLTEGQSANTLIDLNGSFVLPVELLSFNAEKKEQTALLLWETAQEMNSDRFEIERSTGADFITIGSVRSAGNTNSITHYSFTDRRPVSGTNYYRLKQIDFDGKHTYSKTVPVTFEQATHVMIVPNPATDRLEIRLPANNNHFTAWQIIDAAGKPVSPKTRISSSTVIADVRSLAKGWYVLQLTGNKTEQQLFIKN
jgi:uncharacterized repeat protein (TIGR03803 family)